mmetsp:Transcript_6695/g.13874  ORF Transcript_6695/g.13874 Transcript_6695/m.13874 type:complete len:220 (-) Transcript_6695:536-1195(-)
MPIELRRQLLLLRLQMLQPWLLKQAPLRGRLIWIWCVRRCSGGGLGVTVLRPWSLQLLTRPFPPGNFPRTLRSRQCLQRVALVSVCFIKPKNAPQPLPLPQMQPRKLLSGFRMPQHLSRGSWRNQQIMKWSKPSSGLPQLAYEPRLRTKWRRRKQCLRSRPRSSLHPRQRSAATARGSLPASCSDMSAPQAAAPPRDCRTRTRTSRSWRTARRCTHRLW